MGNKAFSITSKHLRAARLFADGLSQANVAESLGLKACTVRSWFDQPLFKAEIDRFVDGDRAAIQAKGIADKQNRLDEYNRRWLLMKALMKARAEWDVLTNVPGGSTGLICREWRGLNELFTVDTGLLKEMREIEKQAAIEVGDWTEKKELTGADGGAIPISIEAAINKAYGEPDKQNTEAG
jgi:hypothetical protein